MSRTIAAVLIIAVGYAVSFGALLYPVVSNLLNQRRNLGLKVRYEDFVQKMPQKEIDRAWKEARAYNRQHRENYIKDAFTAEEDYVLTHPYDQLLNPDGSAVMGTVEIPKIRITLAIHHGVGRRALEEGCGHIEGTSLPVGGAGCHAVIAAHRGLPGAKLFTDLNQLEVGDEFYLHILDRILAYQVDRVRIIRPQTVDALKIEKGKDLVTLMTCTPYGVNSHRLLVRGHRVRYVPEHEERQALQAGPAIPFSIVALVLGLQVILLFGVIRRIVGNRGRMR